LAAHPPEIPEPMTIASKSMPFLSWEKAEPPMAAGRNNCKLQLQLQQQCQEPGHGYDGL
jgi:hypothetical protein